jgi:hypothetical protein
LRLPAVNRVERQVNATVWWTGLWVGFLLPKDVHDVHDVHASAHLRELVLVCGFEPGRPVGGDVLFFRMQMSQVGIGLVGTPSTS